jgi:hypothetical protein
MILVAFPGDCTETVPDLSSNGNLDLDTSLNVDNDLLDNLGRGIQTARRTSASTQKTTCMYTINILDKALVDAHLKGIPGLGTFTIGRLSGGDAQVLGGQADRSLDAEILSLGTVDELSAHLLEALDVAGSQGDADLVDFLREENRVSRNDRTCVEKGAWTALTGPSPKSFSPFW